MAPHASFGEGLPPELFFTLLTTPSVVRYARTPTGSSSFSTGRALTHQRSSPVRLGSNSRSPPARYYHTPILCIFSCPSFLASLLFTSYSSVLLPCPTHKHVPYSLAVATALTRIRWATLRLFLCLFNYFRKFRLPPGGQRSLVSTCGS